MKKHLAFLLAVLMIFSLVACGAGEKEKDSAPATPPVGDGSADLDSESDAPATENENVDGSLADGPSVSGIQVPFAEGERVFISLDDHNSSIYRVVYDNRAFVIRTSEELTAFQNSMNTLLHSGYVFGEELQRKYTSEYFEENALWLIPVDISGGPQVNISSFEKTVSEAGDVSYTVTVEYVVRADGLSNCEIAYECLVLETKAESGMVNINVITKTMTTEI